MSSQPAPMPTIQGEAMELVSRVPPLALNSNRGGASRGGQPESPAAAAVSTSMRSSGGGRPTPEVISQAGEGGPGKRQDNNARPKSRGEAGSGDRKVTEDTNETKSKLLGGYLRTHLLANITASEPAKELVKRSFRHLHRGQGHVLTLDEFKEGLSNTFGALIPLQLIHATFDIFDTEPRTWQLDFDEFCHWLETGERVLNSHGIMKSPPKTGASATKKDPPKARKPRSNDTSGEFKSSVEDSGGGGMSMEQAERAQLKAHLMKHRSRLHKVTGLTEAQKSIVDHILLDKIKAKRKVEAKTSAPGSFDALEEFNTFARGSNSLAWPAFKKEVTAMLPHLHEEAEIKDAFNRMDHNGDGVIDLKDFLMWEERMQEGRANTDFFALQEEDHLEQIKLARSKASNLLVPDDYDGSTYHAKLSRTIAEKKRAEEAAANGGGQEQQLGSHGGKTRKGSTRDDLAQALRDNILSQVKGGTLEMLRAFRHFRPAAIGRRLFMDYREFRESIKQKGLGLSEEDIKSLFGYFDVDGSGEIDFSEFRRFLQGGNQRTGLAMGVNRHMEKTVAARSRVAALESNTALDASLVRKKGDARCDQLLKAKVLLHITGGQAELLRALRSFGADKSKGDAEMDYATFAGAISKAGFNLSDSETKQVFSEFHISGPSERETNGTPTGKMSAQAFREWLLESHISTGLDVGEITQSNNVMTAEQAAEQTSLASMHQALRAKVVASFKSDHRNLLRAFRGVTRKKGSGITAADFRDALSSFGLSDDKPSADRLFSLYDWRQGGIVSFQELMETITSSELPPRRLNSSQRKRRLEEESRLPDEAIRRAENALRRGLWKKHLDNAEGCFRAITGGKGRTMGLEGLKSAAIIAGVRGEAAGEVALKQILHKHATTMGGDGGMPGWSLQDFANFYRPADCRKAMALARERDGDGQTEEDLKKAALITEGNKARTKLMRQVRRLSQALKAADNGTPVRTGKVSRKTFAKALAKEGGLGRVGEAELTRLLKRHGCSEQGGSYVNYPVFVASFAAAVRDAEHASVVAAVAAANATAAVASASVAAPAAKGSSGMVSGMMPAKYNKGSGGPVRSKSNPQLALMPPRPRTAAAAASGDKGTTTSTANANRESAPGALSRRPPTPKVAPPSPVPGGSGATNGPVIGGAGIRRAQTADGGSRQRRMGMTDSRKVHAPSYQGYFKRFTASGGDIDNNALMKVSKSAPALPDLVGQRPEVPKTTPIHRVMKKDVSRSAKELRKAFKQCENPYRRGVVSVEQFQDVCVKNGVTVDREDIDFLLRLHRHKPSMGGKYAIPPKWVQAPPPGTVDSAGAARDTSKVGVRYDEFLRTCLSATEVPMVAAN